jgi:hypothetical protein
MTAATYLSYQTMVSRQRTGALRQSEIPTEHAVSVALPTKRWGDPAYAYFASPALRTPAQPMRQGAPDRWWLIDAHSGRLIIYALWKIFPFAQGVDWPTVALPEVTLDISALEEKMQTLSLLIDVLAPAFFADKPEDRATKQALVELLTVILPAPLLPQYHALTPDFFSWLNA